METPKASKTEAWSWEGNRVENSCLATVAGTEGGFIRTSKYKLVVCDFFPMTQHPFSQVADREMASIILNCPNPDE